REITQLFPKKEPNIQEEVMRVEGLSKTGYFADVSFSLHKGEIVGFTGLVGAGRSEVCQAIFGIHPYERGKVFIDGKEVTIRNPQDAIGLGIGYLPEDRQKQSLILSWDIVSNITLSALGKLAHKGWIRRVKERVLAKRLSEKVHV